MLSTLRTSNKRAAFEPEPRRTAVRIRCRQIDEDDLAPIIELLTRGFPHRGRLFWIRALGRLRDRPTPSGYPRYGYMLENCGVAVGVVLMLFNAHPFQGKARIRCNLSSFYVDPEYRGYAALLALSVRRYPETTFTNITPSRHTVPMIEAQGFVRYCSGRFIAFPALSPYFRRAFIDFVNADETSVGAFDHDELELLRAHAALGCLSLFVEDGSRRYPFIIAPRRKFGVLPFAYLVYCRDLSEFVRCAGSIGRYLARRGIVCIFLDADGPIPGLAGTYSNGYPKYFRGPDRPRLNDVAYSEKVLFGV